jgi:hypothetical protein
MSDVAVIIINLLVVLEFCCRMSCRTTTTLGDYHQLARCIETLLQDELPYNDYFEYYGPDYRLHISPSNMENLNDRSYLDGVIAKVTD